MGPDCMTKRHLDVGSSDNSACHGRTKLHVFDGADVRNSVLSATLAYLLSENRSDQTMEFA